MARVAIFSTHPIQYQSPWFRALTQCSDHRFTVYYSTIPDQKDQGGEFQVEFSWDIPLLDGYDWKVLPNWRARPSINGFFGSIQKGIGKLLGVSKPDIVILTGWHQFPLLQALLACKLRGIPCIVRGESNNLKPRSSFVRALHRVLLKRFDAYLYIGSANQAFYRQYGVSDERLFPCRYFVDNQRFEESSITLSGQRDAIRADWGVSEQAFCLLYMGKLNSKKRIGDLLKAMIQVRSALGASSGTSVAVELLIVGSGELAAWSKQFVAEHNLPVVFAGFLNQSEVAKAYVVADILVLPSDYGETWGLVVNEAMACGLPAIVSDRVGCAVDLVKEGETGYTYPCGDVAALAEVILKAASDRECTAIRGTKAQSDVLQDYSVEGAVRGTLQAIRSLE